MKPRIGLIMGDPCGIGPELTAKLLNDADVRARAEILVVGDHRILLEGEGIAGCSINVHLVDDANDATFEDDIPVVLDTPKLSARGVAVGKVSREGGKWSLDCLAAGLALASDKHIDGFCFAPLNKEAMHMAGLKHEDELGFFIETLGHTGPTGLINTLGTLWTSRVTSHVAHKDVSGLITKESVLQAIRIAHDTLHRAGYEAPRIAVAGLNPHAGDGGNFGREEIDVIAPAVAAARTENIPVDGPFPADTVFLKARNGDYHAVVTMYHDQGQVAMKLMGFDHGVTVHAGLPFPVATSAHGSAFDIAGQNLANVDALRAAFDLLCNMAEREKA